MISTKEEISDKGRPMTQNITFEAWEAEQMQGPEFRAAVEELEPEYRRERRQMYIGDHIICPGCGWTGDVSELTLGACPQCEYENNQSPQYRLLTLGEIRATTGRYDDVRLDLFLEAYIRLLK